MTTGSARAPGGARAVGRGLWSLAMTACPTGIAHTYLAAEKLARAAEALGHSNKVGTQGSIGAENVLSDNDIESADALIVAADKDVDRSRLVGKRVLATGVAGGIHHPKQLIEPGSAGHPHGGVHGARTSDFARFVAGIKGALDGTQARLVSRSPCPKPPRTMSICAFWRCCRRSLVDAGFRERLQSAPDEAAVMAVLAEVR
ncbi:fructose-specific phosphotransferase system IIB component [Streptomyces zagrosensis]|uniref:Fructose-specific phosphotransferase system IIB component n=1 Tax=Streptomyces zagrosensis TaxID=1042984 RepID=A0A7W9QH16_9ACTN|nr:fructose-specific phosphotransferase system IIB component [Streptomyces zagrosensis]